MTASGKLHVSNSTNPPETPSGLSALGWILLVGPATFLALRHGLVYGPLYIDLLTAMFVWTNLALELAMALFDNYDRFSGAATYGLIRSSLNRSSQFKALYLQCLHNDIVSLSVRFGALHEMICCSNAETGRDAFGTSRNNQP
jgi:hypothetical protein